MRSPGSRRPAVGSRARATRRCAPSLGGRGARVRGAAQADQLSTLRTGLLAPTSGGGAAAGLRPAITVGGMTTRLTRVVDLARRGASFGHPDAAEVSDLDASLALDLGL